MPEPTRGRSARIQCAGHQAVAARHGTVSIRTTWCCSPAWSTSFNVDGDAIKVDWSKQRKRLQDLDGDGQNAILNALTVASLVGSYVRRPQKEFLQEVHADCGRAVQPGAFKRLRRRLIDGQPITTKDLDSLRR